MKKVILLFLFALAFTTVNSQVKQDNYGNFIGYAEKSDFLESQKHKGWFNQKYTSYKTDEAVIKKIKKNLKGITVVGFMGTWCGDSKRETPRFYKVMEEAGFKLGKNFKLVTVNRSKKTPENLEEGLNIVRVPTFIFYKNGKEIGRYVEYARETLEKDILKILKGEPYKHSYDR